MKKKLSTHNRPKLVKHLSATEFDLLVIGGGITGAGIALDAASRGLKVALVEKNDFASGTSSKSTKLIHGGLRYLKQFEFDLVREVGGERKILHKNAPHIVYAENMLLPIIEGGSLGRFTTNIGLSVYDWLAGVKFSEWKRMLSKFSTKKKEPLLRSVGLKGGAIYKEYRTDDARLVIEVLKAAAEYESYALNYAEVNELIYENKIINGAKVLDHDTGEEIVIKAKKVVNAAGPWVDQVRKKDAPVRGKKLHQTKGVHLVVPFEKLPVKQSVYFDVADGRMIFVIPRDGITYIGTTDTNYTKDLDSPGISKKDVTYLLAAVNKMFPTVKITVKDVTSTWSGLRPLIHEEGKSPSELSRKDEIFYAKSGLISIAGGKLTGYRKMAERVVNVVAKQLEKEGHAKIGRCFTSKIAVAGGQFKDKYEIPEYIERLIKTYRKQGIEAKDIERLTYKYGSNTETILKLAKQQTEDSAHQRMLMAELEYGIDNELVTNLNDFLIRRSGRLYFNRPSIADEYPLLKKKIATLLKWNKKQVTDFDAAFQKEYEAVLSFD